VAIETTAMTPPTKKKQPKNISAHRLIDRTLSQALDTSAAQK
jgi:hypothetical protein